MGFLRSGYPTTFRTSLLLVLLGMFMGMLGLGCSLHNSMVSLPKRYSGQQKVERIYIYSFLDFRGQTIGPNLLAEFRKEIETSMKTHGIETEQLWFNDSPIRERYSFSETTTPTYNRNSGSSVSLPVKEVILANLDKEKEFHPTHLLVLFPSEVKVQGAGVSFSTKLTLVNPRTLQEEWSAMTSSRFVNQMKTDEIPKERAVQLAKYMTDVMAQAGMF